MQPGSRCPELSAALPGAQLPRHVTILVPPQTNPAGFYDYGPPGCAMKQNVTQTWRNHFVLEENMLEVGGWGRVGGGGSADCSSSVNAQWCCVSMLWCLELRPIMLPCCSTP